MSVFKSFEKKIKRAPTRISRPQSISTFLLEHYEIVNDKLNISDDKSNFSESQENVKCEQNLTFSSQEPFKILEMLESHANSGNFSPNLIDQVCKYLKLNGKALDEGSLRDTMDLYFVTIRNIARDNRLDQTSRAKLLDIIELRAMSWNSTDAKISFFSKKIDQLINLNKSNNQQLSTPKSANNWNNLSLSNSSPLIAMPNQSNETMKHSPTKVSGKNFIKDELVIRNSDSGKVMGIKGRRVHIIEEMSDTVISFQRVNPNAKDRLLQITGPNDKAINKAKYLIEDTIMRNASPVPFEDTSGKTLLTKENEEVNTFNPGVMASNLPYIQAVSLGNELIIVSSSSSSLVEEAKAVLIRHFRKKCGRELSESSDSDISISRNNQNLLTSNESEETKLKRQSSFHYTKNFQDKGVRRSRSHGSFSSGKSSDFKGKAIICYDRDFLLSRSKSSLCQSCKAFEKALEAIPEIIKKC